MKKLIPLFVVVFSATATASELWTGSAVTDGLWISHNMSIVLDWAQTSNVANRPDKYEEINDFTKNIIGEHPTTGDVNRYFIASLLIHNSVYYFLPEKWKLYYSGIGFVYRSDTIQNNYEIGVSINF